MTDTENRETGEKRANRENRTNRQTMADASHTHPNFENGGVNDLFRRGPRAMTDGGTRDGATRAETERDAGERRSATGRTMADVSHTPPSGDRDVNRVFARGGESASAEEDEGSGGPTRR